VRAQTLLLALLLASTAAFAAGPDVKVDDLCRAVVDDSNYKVRVQAALVLGKLGDARAVQPLKKARRRMRGGLLGIGDSNTTACLKKDAEAAILALGGDLK
jgi:HEAT repeat protein